MQNTGRDKELSLIWEVNGNFRGSPLSKIFPKKGTQDLCILMCSWYIHIFGWLCNDLRKPCTLELEYTFGSPPVLSVCSIACVPQNIFLIVGKGCVTQADRNSNIFENIDWHEKYMQILVIHTVFFMKLDAFRCFTNPPKHVWRQLYWKRCIWIGMAFMTTVSEDLEWVKCCKVKLQETNIAK